MAGKFLESPFTSKQVVSVPLVHVQLDKTETDGFSFLAHEVVQGRINEAIYSDGGAVYYSSPEAHTRIGYVVHNGCLPVRRPDDQYVPYYNALADLKVFVDTAISVIAKTLELIAQDHLLVVDRAGKLKLVLRNSVSPGESLGALDLLVYEASHEGEVVINDPRGTVMAGMLIAHSAFDPAFLDALGADVAGSNAMKGLYHRIAGAARRAVSIHAGWASLPANPAVRLSKVETAAAPL